MSSTRGTYSCDPRAELAALVGRLEQVVAEIRPDEVLARHAPEIWDVCTKGANLFHATQALLARRVADAGVHKAAGAKDAAEHLALRSGITKEEARSMLATSDHLVHLPATEAALRSGQLSTRQTHRIADAASAGPHQEQNLLDLAGKVSLKELGDEAGRVKAAADPDPESTRRRQHRERYFRQGTGADGSWWFTGKGKPEDRGRFDAALNPILEGIFRQARADGRREPREAYSYDAMQELARRAHRHPHEPATGRHDPQPGSRPPHGPQDQTAHTPPIANSRPSLSLLPVLRLDLPALHRDAVLPGELCEITGVGPVTPTAARELLGESIVKLALTNDGAVVSVAHIGRLSDRPTHLALLHADITALAGAFPAPGEATCSILGVGTIPTEPVRRLLGDVAGIDLLKRVLDRGRDVVRLVHPGRQPTVAQRVALLWTQPTCSVEGCPHTFAQIDHRHEWHKDQVTELTNLDRLCPHHHRLKTNQGFQLTPGSGDRPFVPPTDPRHPFHINPEGRDRAPPEAA